MQKLNILFGFNEPAFEEGVKKTLQTSGYEANIIVKLTKLSIREYLRVNEYCNTVVLKEVMSSKSIYSAEELSELTDFRDVNVIIVINSRHNGTEFMHILYNAGITCAIFQDGKRGATPKQVGEFVINKRTRRQAREYYGIDNRKVETGILDMDYFYEIYNDMLCQNTEKTLIENYLAVCRRLNQQQLYDFTRRLPEERINELKRYEEFFDVVRSLKKSGFNLKIKRKRKTKIGLHLPNSEAETNNEKKMNEQPAAIVDVTAESAEPVEEGGKEKNTLFDLAGQLFRVDERDAEVIPDNPISETDAGYILPDRDTLSNEQIDIVMPVDMDEPRERIISLNEAEGMKDKSKRVKPYYPIMIITTIVSLLLLFLAYGFSLI